YEHPARSRRSGRPVRRCQRDPRLFFFQAEDGIRDFHVTGVQTCALPIYGATQAAFADRLGISNSYLNQIENNQRPVSAAVLLARSEERRVGKECRSRRSR